MLYKLFFKKCNDPPKYFKLKKYYTMGPGIDFPLIMNYTDTGTGNGEPYFYFLNGHGDVTYFAAQNFTEEQIETYEYTPWDMPLTSASKNNLLYTAREFDFDAGWQFNRMRYYNPNLGRFMQKDIIIHKENIYAYAKNRPTYYSDKFGLLPEWLQRFYIVPFIVVITPVFQYPDDQCFSPSWYNDCATYCPDLLYCIYCCYILYPYDTQIEEFNRCISFCK